MASIDIAVPCYKYGHFLRDCVSSVLTQDVGDLRVLIIDDASPDNSFDVASELAAADNRVEAVRHKTNQGLIPTLNDGIDWASADYFMVLSADDLLVPGCFGRALAILERHPDVGFLHGAEGKLFPEQAIPRFDDTAQAAAEVRFQTGEQFVQNVCRTGVNSVGVSTALLRTAVQKAAGHYNPKLPHTSDFEMWLRVAAISRVAETDAVQGIRRHHGANMSDYYFSVVIRDYLERKATLESFFAAAGQGLPRSKQLCKLATHSLAEEAYWVGLSRICRGQPTIGFELVKFALALAPSFAVLPPIDYLLRRKGSFHRVVEVVTAAIRGHREVPVR